MMADKRTKPDMSASVRLSETGQWQDERPTDTDRSYSSVCLSACPKPQKINFPVVPVRVSDRFFRRTCHGGTRSRDSSAPNKKMEIGIPVFPELPDVTERNWPWKP